MEQLTASVREGGGLVLIAEEALTAPAMARLQDVLSEQPPWSDLPLLIVVHAPISARALERLESLGNVTLLERPLRIPALLSAVRAAQRARTRQYQMRDLMIDLRDASHAKDDFLAAVSHELRTPLNAIAGWATLMLRMTNDPDRFRQAAEVIDRNSRVLTRLVDDLIDKARIAKGQFLLNLADVDLVRVVHAAVEAVAPAAEAKRVSITADLPETLPFHGDAVRLQQALWNLLWNAVKFTPDGGAAHICLRSADGRTEITVSDSGEGISADLLPHIFEPFRHGEGQGSGRYAGLGLGLALVRRFVELHGGTVTAESGGAGRGATFRIELPVGTGELVPSP